MRLNDVPLTTPATVLPNLRGVTVDGQPVQAAEAARLFLFHKPSGLITAERDHNGRPTIYTALRNALPPGTPRVMPVGRLDLNTEGLLLLTNDGELKRALELPSSEVPRTYRARTYGDISQAQLEDLIEGIEIGGIRYGKIDANMERRTGRNQWIELTLTEGKNREVRRVLEHLGLEVSRLLRVAYGPFILGDLPRGAAGEIAPVEVEKFRRTLGLAAQDPGAVRRTARVDAPPPRAEPEGRRRGARPVARPAAKPAAGAAAATSTQSGRRPPRARHSREDEGQLLNREDLRRGRRAARTEPRPATPATERPAGARPQRPGGPAKPTGAKPTGDRPTGDRPTGDRPTGGKPYGGRPGPSKPRGRRP